MIPLRDNIPVRRTPVVCILLIALNLVAFLVDRMLVASAWVDAETGRIVRVGILDHYAAVPANVSTDLAHQWPTVFGSLFLHSNWLHIGGNMLYLWIFGANVEDTLGRFRFLVFYLACGAAAVAAHVMTDPNSTTPLVGASGAVAGLMGAYLVLFPAAEILSIVPLFVISTIMEVPAIIIIGYWAFLNFANAYWLQGGEFLRGGGVAYFAHIGGFVAGIVLIFLLGGKGLLQKRRRPERDYYYR